MSQIYESFELGKMLINYSLNQQINVLSTIENLGAIQIDPISVVAPNHHLVLSARIKDYKTINLETAIESKKLLEVYAHERCFVPIDDIRLYWNHMINYRHKNFKIYQSYEDIIKKIISQIKDNGAISVYDLESISIHDNKDSWGSNKETTKLLDFLWQSGYIVVIRRQGNRKWFDLLENVISDDKLKFNLNLEELRVLRWEKYFYSIGATNIQDSKIGFEKTTLSERKKMINKMINLGKLQSLKIKNSQQEYFALPNFHNNLESNITEQPLLVPPLDNLLWNRNRLEDIWDFYYRWEIYTSPSKRKIGAYGMPLVACDRILGQADVKFERENSTLLLKNISPLSAIKFSLFIEKLEEAANKLANFLEADKVIFTINN